MSPHESRLQLLKSAIPARFAPTETQDAVKHMRLAASGDTLKIARQIFDDRSALLPFESMPARYEGADPDVLKRWLKGGDVPDGHKESIAAWLQAQTARRLAIGELERRLRASIWAWRTLAQSELPDDKRCADSFRRWHFDNWQIIDLPMHAPAGQEQPTEAVVKAAVCTRAGR